MTCPSASTSAARLGAAVVDRLVEPLLGGVYAGHARRLSLQATMPVLWARATRGESLVAAPATVTASANGSDAPAAPRPPFAGLRGGVGRLPELVADEVARRGATLRTGCRRP